MFEVSEEHNYRDLLQQLSNNKVMRETYRAITGRAGHGKHAIQKKNLVKHLKSVILESKKCYHYLGWFCMLYKENLYKLDFFFNKIYKEAI